VNPFDYGAALWEELEKMGWVIRGNPSLAIFISVIARVIFSFPFILFMSESLEDALMANFIIHGFRFYHRFHKFGVHGTIYCYVEG
jgi:hypothetical protein